MFEISCKFYYLWSTDNLTPLKISPNVFPIRGDHSSPMVVYWCPSPLNFNKLNFDGLVKSYSTTTSVILCNNNGKCLKACFYKFGNMPIIVTKITSLCNGIHIALEEKINNIIIEWENIIPINVILGKLSSTWVIDHIVEDIITLLNNFNAWEIENTTKW